MSERVVVDFRTEPRRYKHWKLACEGRVATVQKDGEEGGGLVPGHEHKLNSDDVREDKRV